MEACGTGLSYRDVEELLAERERSRKHECFQTAKNQAGLDHYQVRGYRTWYAHITLAMPAAYLAATRAQEAKKGDPDLVAAH